MIFVNRGYLFSQHLFNGIVWHQKAVLEELQTAQWEAQDSNLDVGYVVVGFYLIQPIFDLTGGLVVTVTVKHSVSVHQAIVSS